MNPRYFKFGEYDERIFVKDLKSLSFSIPKKSIKKDWAEKLNVAQLELYKVNIALTIAEKTYDEYFTPIIDVQ